MKSLAALRMDKQDSGVEEVEMKQKWSQIARYS